MAEIKCPACGYCIQLHADGRGASSDTNAAMLPGGSWPEAAASPFSDTGGQAQLLPSQGQGIVPDQEGPSTSEATAYAESDRSMETQAMEARHEKERRREMFYSPSAKRKNEERRREEHKRLEAKHEDERSREHGRRPHHEEHRREEHRRLAHHPQHEAGHHEREHERRERERRERERHHGHHPEHRRLPHHAHHEHHHR